MKEYQMKLRFLSALVVTALSIGTISSALADDSKSYTEVAVMKARLIGRSTRTTVGMSQYLLGENFTVLPRCGQTHRIGTRITQQRKTPTERACAKSSLLNSF